MRQAYDLVRQQLGVKAERMKRHYDLRVRPQKFRTGEWVLYYNPRKTAEMGEEVLSLSHHQRITTSELSHPEIEEKSTNHLPRRQVEEMDNRRSSEIVVDVQRMMMMTMM